ncbi:uncharacterized protein LOC117397338 isoform X1 [Acipenser ruthenus]|uniref:uncharacterized protein LOC117397338 isoform X1 n=1 Tax=Acipenser ruthenus TaxID=7906 RepID=UPI002741FF95|nr:uncharacterized protein LOC117397338 isoform X1 [Acipenser ruthenus]XP_058866252.1 uncharacterized protein LOC117397338 isoform X1 [Acipenser ruthenus]XP_058866253.1 uncharacterized protein LOC117397338 isoform X1 [Acipenser ruthenus]
MASSRAEKNWSELQESLNRVRRQRGVVPRTGWDSLLSSGTNLQPPVSASQHRQRQVRSTPYLPSLTAGDGWDQTPTDFRRSKRTPEQTLSAGTASERGGRVMEDLTARPSVFPVQRGVMKGLETLEPRQPLLQIVNTRELETEAKAPATLSNRHRDCAAALYFTENKRFAWDCVNSFIADVLSDELIPDLLIEVFSRDSVQQSSPVKLPSTDSVKKQRQSNAGRVQEHTSRLPSMLFGELLQEVMLDVSAEVLRSAVKGFVDSHLTKAAIYDSMSEIVTETAQELIPGLVREVQAGLAVDSVLEEELLPEVVSEEARTVVLSVLGEHDSEISRLQLAQVSHYAARRLMDSFLMDHLVALVENHGQSFVQKEQSRKLLDSWIVNTLFHQYHSVRRQRDATLENVLLRHHHQKVFTDVALDVILGELAASVDEDVEDLLEHERQMEGEGFTG